MALSFSFFLQIRRCDKPSCTICHGQEVVKFMLQPIESNQRPGHYKKYDELSSEDAPTDDHVPSIRGHIRKVSSEVQGCPLRVLVAQNARQTSSCNTCDKPRVIYAKQVLSSNHKRSLRNLRRKYGPSFMCGCVLIPDDHPHLKGVLFTRVGISCESPVEREYYTSLNIPKIHDLCPFCLTRGAKVSTELKKNTPPCFPFVTVVEPREKKTSSRG